ncbi:MAG: sigma-70 family RNA polymerase sigma factor [Chloroflexi bacterium]|nr:sigma-70 family RNA polymerase sigma factor [Chloroflexota bacterium]
MRLCVAGATTMDAHDVSIGAMEEDGDSSLLTPQSQVVDLASIYVHHRDAMFRAATSILGSQERSVRGVSAQDVVQQVMRRLQANGLPADVQDLRRYLLTAVRNQARDAIRRATRETTDEHGPVRTRHEEPLSDIVTDRLVDPSHNADVEAVVLEHLDEERIRGHLHLLTDNQRRAIVGRVFESHSPSEVAADLNVSPQRISQLVRAGATRLLRAMGELEDNHDRPT